MTTTQVDKTFTIDGKQWTARPKRPRYSTETVYGLYCGRSRWGLAQQLEDLPLHKVWVVIYWPYNNITPVALNVTANSLQRAVEILHERVYPTNRTV